MFRIWFSGWCVRCFTVRLAREVSFTVIFLSFTSSSSCISENCTLHRKLHQPPPPSPPTSLPASTGGDTNSSSPSHEPKEKRVHFDLETLHSYRLRTHTASVRGRPGMVGRPGLGLGGLGLGNLGSFTTPPQISLHVNGGPVSALASTGLVLSPIGGRAAQTSLWEGELQELQGKIEIFRTQLREALARRAEIQTSLERERSRLVRRDTSLERERDRQSIQTINTDRSSSSQSTFPERDRTSQLQTLNNQQIGRANQSGGPGALEQERSSQLNTFNSLDRGRANQIRSLNTWMGERTVQSRTSTSLERSRVNQPGAGNVPVQSRNTSSLDRQKANLSRTLNTLERTKANPSSVSSETWLSAVWDSRGSSSGDDGLVRMGSRVWCLLTSYNMLTYIITYCKLIILAFRIISTLAFKLQLKTFHCNRRADKMSASSMKS